MLPLPHIVVVVLAGALLLVAVGILSWLVGHLLTAVFRLVFLGGVNRAGGTLFGLLQGALLLCMILAAGSSPSAPAGMRRKVDESTSARPFVACGRELLEGWQQARRSSPPASKAR